MRQNGIAILAVLLSAASFAAAFFYHREYRRSLAANAELQARLEATQARLAELDKNDRAVAPGEAPRDGATKPAPASTPPPGPGGFMRGLLSQMGKSAEGYGGDAQNPLAAVGSMGQEMLKAMGGPVVAMQMDQMYGAFFRDANLPQETEAAALAAIEEQLRQQMEQGLKLLTSKDGLSDSQFKDLAGSEQKLREKLSPILGADALAQFDAYQKEMPYEMAASAALSALDHTGVSAAARDRVHDVFVEEYRALQTDGAAPTDPASAMSSAGEVYERALDRLAEEIQPEEFARIEQALGQQQQMMDSFSGIVSRFLPRAQSQPAP